MAISGTTALVTGITSTIGDRIAVSLAQHGVKVKGLIRRPEQVEIAERIGIEPVLGNLTDMSSLRKALQGVDLLVHAAAYVGEDMALSQTTNVQGTRNVAQAALDTGVPRMVHISTVSVYGHPDEGTLDERYPLSVNHRHAYVITKAEAERLLGGFRLRGLEISILRPGAICAERNSKWGDRLVQRYAVAEEVTGLHPEDIVPWVHADSLAQMVTLVASRPEAAGQAYNAVDGNYSVSDFQLRICRALGKPAPVPDRPPSRALYIHERIRQLGYRPLRTFDETMVALEKQARDLVALGQV